MGNKKIKHGTSSLSVSLRGGLGRGLANTLSLTRGSSPPFTGLTNFQGGRCTPPRLTAPVSWRPQVIGPHAQLSRPQKHSSTLNLSLPQRKP
jgi:hypothetical protein